MVQAGGRTLRVDTAGAENDINLLDGGEANRTVFGPRRKEKEKLVVCDKGTKVL